MGCKARGDDHEREKWLEGNNPEKVNGKEG
jgi:hypothetical protein